MKINVYTLQSIIRIVVKTCNFYYIYESDLTIEIKSNIITFSFIGVKRKDLYNIEKELNKYYRSDLQKNSTIIITLKN